MLRSCRSCRAAEDLISHVQHLFPVDALQPGLLEVALLWPQVCSTKHVPLRAALLAGGAVHCLARHLLHSSPFIAHSAVVAVTALVQGYRGTCRELQSQVSDLEQMGVVRIILC